MKDDDIETRLFVLKGEVQTPGGKIVPAQYINFTLSRLAGPNATDHALMRRLIRYGIPTDLDCFNLVIAGTGMNEPDYLFQFTGTIVEDINRTDAITSEPFDFLLTNSDKEKPAIRMIGYIWQSLVLLKEDGSYCAETYNPKGPSVEPSFRNMVSTTTISSLVPIEARAKVMRKLARGYESMIDLRAMISKVKYTAQEAQEKSDVIIANALPHIEMIAYSKKADLKIEPLAKKMKMGKQTIYDVDTACRFHGQPGLIERLKEAYRQKLKLRR